MNIDALTLIVKKKLHNSFKIENILIEDKSFLHKGHPGNEKGRFHLKITIQSNELKQLKKIESNKKIYRILQEEISQYIHSIQILIS